MAKICSLKSTKRTCVVVPLLGGVTYLTLMFLQAANVNDYLASTFDSVRLMSWSDRDTNTSSTSGGGDRQTGQGRLLILTYMRSGSSMTGSIFDRHPHVFYWFEPLHVLKRLYNKRNRFIDKWQREALFASSDEATGNISAFLSCNVDKVYGPSLTDDFMAHGRGTSSFRPCFLGGGSMAESVRTGPGLGSAEWDDCVDGLASSCLHDYRLVALKTIRFGMARALDLLRSDPHLKILHLVRDPRGVLESRRRLGFFDVSDVRLEARNLCQVMSMDLDDAQSALADETESVIKRYMLVRYEDIATNVREMAKRLYAFAGLVYDDDVLRSVDWLEKTAPVKTGDCPTCGHHERVNSTVRSQEWRLDSRPEDVHIISEECFQLMRQLGYRTDLLTQQDLFDPTISAVGRPILSVDSAQTSSKDKFLFFDV